MNLNTEKYLFRQGFSKICGVDEAGRGACAGPIVAGAVVFDKGILRSKKLVSNIKESKKLSQEKREELFEIIRERALCWAVGIVKADEIDIINIGYANRLCIRDAVKKLSVQPEYIVCDYVQKLSFQLPYELFTKGDDNIICIAAASIIAKVTRDNIMEKYSQDYPQYGFEKHKGYGTKEHYDCIHEYGICPLHRKSFGVAQKRMF